MCPIVLAHPRYPGLKSRKTMVVVVVVVVTYYMSLIFICYFDA